jgi:hypothetical protein
MTVSTELEREVSGGASRGLGQKLMDMYFLPKRIEKWKNGRLYELLGIRTFKKVCVQMANTFGWDNYFIADGSLEGLNAYEKRTRVNEAIHSPFTLVFTYQIISFLIEGSYLGAVIVGPIWLLNALPTALQRYNRVKIGSVLQRMASRKGTVKLSAV